MALSLFKTSRFARLYQDREYGVIGTGVMKATIGPMHYESVAGSGVFDTAIDLTWAAVDNSTLDGYEMTNAAYHWELQTDVLAESQQPQGTVTFRSRDDVHELILRPVQLAYFHEPTEAVALIGTAFDYTAGSVTAETTRISRTRDLGSHAGVPSEVVGVAGAMRWNTLDTINAETIWSEYITAAEMMEIGTMFNGDAASWVLENDPPLTTISETKVGVLYEVDWTGIPHVYLANGSEVDPLTDSFNNTLGNIDMRDDGGNLIGQMQRAYNYGAYGLTFSETQTDLFHYFWRDGGTNYMLVGATVDWWIDEPDPVFTAFGICHRFRILTEEQGEHRIEKNDGHGGEYWAGPGYVRENMYIGTGRYFGADDHYTWDLLTRFRHEIPGGAPVTTGSQYANLTHYDFYYPATGRYNQDRGTFGAAVEIDCHIDVSSPEAGYIVNGQSPSNPGTPWRDSTAYFRLTGDYPAVDGDPHTPMDVSLPMEEFLGLARTHSGKTVRLSVRGNELNGDYVYAIMDAYGNPFGKGSMLDVEFAYPASNKPGFKDGGGERNARESRFFSSRVPYRLGVNDEPNINTPDNKNRSRFS